MSENLTKPKDSCFWLSTNMALFLLIQIVNDLSKKFTNTALCKYPFTLSFWAKSLSFPSRLTEPATSPLTTV